MILERVCFDIVTGCQLKCIGCPLSNMDGKIKYITVENFKKITKNIDVKEVKRLRLFSFGEPILHPKLPEIVHLAKHVKWATGDIEMSTNGQYYNEERIKAVFKQKVINGFFVSADGDGTPEEYERMRPPAKWDKLMWFLKRVKRLRDRYCPKMFLGVRSICSDSKAKRRWAKLLKPMGWTVEFRGMANAPGAKYSEGKEYQIPEGVCKIADPKSHGMPRLYVGYNGDVVPCCRHPFAYLLGNLVEMKYTDILKSKKYLTFWDEITNHRLDMDICGKCDQK